MTDSEGQLRGPIKIRFLRLKYGTIKRNTTAFFISSNSNCLLNLTSSHDSFWGRYDERTLHRIMHYDSGHSHKTPNSVILSFLFHNLCAFVSTFIHTSHHCALLLHVCLFHFIFPERLTLRLLKGTESSSMHDCIHGL